MFEPDEELVHVGRGPDNQIVLDDASIDEHQASLLQKNGRYAIYRPEEADVLVDGSDIPAGKWVWLPTDARLQFGRRTSCQFSYEAPLDSGDNGAASGGHAEPESEQLEAEQPVATAVETAPVETAAPPALPDKKPKAKRKKSAKRKRQTARFITDRGDTLVELGADGHLPELSLEDGPARKQKGEGKKKSGPALLYCALGLSLLSSMGLLLLDSNPPTVSEMSRSKAREEIVHFFGNDDKHLQPWQESLRAARLASSRRDYPAEVAEYRKVLNLLNSEDRDPHIGVTGHLNGDKELRQLIGIIINR